LSDTSDGVGEKKHYERPESGYTAIMSGVSGGLLTSCLSNGIACKGIIIHTTANVPDPEAASILIETINELRDNQLNVNVEDLKNKGKLIKKQLEEMIKTVMEQQQQNSQSVNTKGTTMYS
jgi:predicted ATP-grasp superfamily ATP-dependent carboligase